MKKRKKKGKLSPRSYLPTKRVFQRKRCNITLHSLPKQREMNKNTSKKRRVALKRKRASPRLGMESLKMKKLLINSSQAPSTKTSRISGQILSNKGKMIKDWTLRRMMAHGTCLEKGSSLIPSFAFIFFSLKFH